MPTLPCGSQMGLPAQWETAWELQRLISTASSQIKIVAGNLTYPNLADPSPVGNEFTISGASASSTFCQFNSSAITGGSVYYAFLAQCTTQPSATEETMSPISTRSATIGSSDPADIYVKASGAGFVMGVRKNGGNATYASSPTVLSLNTTYLVVLKYTFNPRRRRRHRHALYQPDSRRP